MENLEQLVEVFDTASDLVYPVVNMKPGSKMPQIFLIKNGEDNNLIVRMMALSGDGDKLRVLNHADKNIIVELMSINDRGRHVVLQGGIGKDPIKTIVTVFDTVYKNLNLQIVDSIMFRFQTKKMKGQTRAINRILERLALTRGKGRFVPLKELSNFTGKFSYVMLHKKKVDLDKLPGAKNISDDVEIVNTNVGDVYVDKSSGKQITKSEIVADAISTTLNKIPEREMVNKTRLSRREIMNAQYSSNVEMTYTIGTKAHKEYEEYSNKIIVSKPDASTKESNIHTMVSTFNDNHKVLKQIEFENIDYAISENDGNELGGIPRMVFYAANQKLSVEESLQIAKKYAEIRHSINLENAEDKFREVVDLMKTFEYEDKEEEIQSCADVLERLASEVSATFANTFGNYQNDDLNENERSALESYCSYGFKDLNGYLIGNQKPTSKSKQLLEDLDKLFVDKGIKLKKGLKLYRGMKIPTDIIDTVFSNKTFYFKNYVSTSLAPIIFGNYANISNNFVHSNGSDDEDIVTKMKNSYQNEREFGLIISGGHKVKVMIPGSISPYPSECEVVLPRGIAIKFDKLVVHKERSRTTLAHVSIVDPDLLDESEIVYDGDALIESGEIKPVDDSNKTSFMKFASTTKSEINNHEIDIIFGAAVENSLRTLPEKFII